VYADGAPFEIPEPSSGLATTYLESGGEPRAVIVHDIVLLQEPELLRSVAAAARLAVDNDRLQAEVRAQLEEVRASRARLVAAADEARRRVERDLHDGAQQRLLALGLALKRAQRRVADDSETAQAIMDEAAAELGDALDELRELARGIHPAILSEQGLVPAVRMLAERSEVPVRIESQNGSPRPPSTVESAAYFVVSEALSNVAKHASATQANVHIEQQPDRILVRVEDNGVGGADVTRGSGLLGLQDRVAAVGGHLRVDSSPGAGTRILAELPCE
jgi:signal transduction histidine kinase